MSLELRKLQQAAKRVIHEEKKIAQLGRELTRVLGPTILTTHGISLMAENANDRLDYLEFGGSKIDPINTSILMQFANSPYPQVRKLVARLLPENLLVHFTKDKNRSVRSIVAKRLPAHLVENMTKRFPNDENLENIYRRKLQEAALDEFSDTWYDTTARKIIQTYDGNLERNWEEIAVQRYCSSLHSQGIDVDATKLMDCVLDLLAERDAAVLDENVRINLNESSLPSRAESEAENPIDVLLRSNLSPSGYMTNFEKLFRVSFQSTPNPGMMFGINESVSRITRPTSAFIPNGVLGAKEEKALDLYVQRWNSQQSTKGTPYVMSWSPSRSGRVEFELGIK